MKYNLLKSFSVLVLTSFLLCHSSYSSHLKEDETESFNAKGRSSYKLPWILKPFCVFSLLMADKTEAQTIPNIKPYTELNFTNWLKMNYQNGDMPDGTYITPQYSWSGPYSSSYASESICNLYQAKIQRAWELRGISNYLYEIIPSDSSLSGAEKYTALAAAVQIEGNSHTIELEAAQLVKYTTSGTTYYWYCAMPTPTPNTTEKFPF